MSIFLWWTVKKGEIFEAEDENGVVHACLNKCHGKHSQSSKEAVMVEELWADEVYELANQPCVYVPFQT